MLITVHCGITCFVKGTSNILLKQVVFSPGRLPPVGIIGQSICTSQSYFTLIWVRIRWTERLMYGGSCTMNQKLKWTPLFSFCNNAHKEYTGLLFIYLIARYDPQIVRYDRRNARYDPRAHWDGSRYDHMPCPLRSLARFFRWRISRVCNRKPIVTAMIVTVPILWHGSCTCALSSILYRHSMWLHVNPVSFTGMWQETWNNCCFISLNVHGLWNDVWKYRSAKKD